MFRKLFILFLFFQSLVFTSARTPFVMATFEGETSTSIAGCVNAISGEYFVSIVDAQVQGIEPISIHRTYLSGNCERDGGSWQIFAETHLEKIFPSKTAKDQRIKIQVRQPSGALFHYRQTHNEKIFHVDRKIHGKGMTNTSSYEISGKTNLKNNRIFIKNSEKECLLITGDGTKKLYRRANKENIFTLRSVEKPNRTFVFYDYDDKDRLVFVKTTNYAKTKMYAFVRIEYMGKPNKNRNCIVTTSDGKTIHYNYKRINHYDFDGEKYGYDFCLQEVLHSHKPREFLNFPEHHREEYFQVYRREFSEGNYQDISYYKQGENENGDRSLKIKEYSDPMRNLVSSISSPSGKDGKLEVTHRFYYNKGPEKGKQPGVTDVYDASGHRMQYFFNKYQRIEKIFKYDKSNLETPLFEEHFYWGDEETNKGFLHAKYIMENGVEIYRKSFKYDECGNVVEDVVEGNLTGERRAHHKAITKYTYHSVGNLNLISSKTLPNGLKISYNHHGESNLLRSILTSYEGKILHRKFFQYDDDCILIKEIEDDGNTPNLSDIDNVTERKIKCIHPKKEHPCINFPEIIEERYLDPKTSQEQLSAKIVLHYNDRCKISQKDIYDASNTHRYSLFYKYDYRDRLIEETDAMGNVSHITYDENNNPIKKDTSNEDFTVENTFDNINRLIQTKQVSTEQTHSTQYEYNVLSQKTKTINLHQNETLHCYDSYGKECQLIHPPIRSLSSTPINPTTSQIHNYKGKVIQSTDAYGNITKKEYTACGMLTKIIHPDDRVESFYYNIDNTLKETVSICQTRTCYEYDLFGNVISKKIITPGGRLYLEEKFQYSAFHLLQKQDACGLITKYVYDGLGRIIKEEITGKRPHITLTSYDPLGRANIITHTDGNLIRKNTKTFDLLDRVLSEIEEDSEEAYSIKTFTYDAFGNQVEQNLAADAGTQTEIYAFDSFKRATTHTDAEGISSTTSYNDSFSNELGQFVLQETNISPMGLQVITTYDALKQVSSKEMLDSSKNLLSREDFYYDGSGNLIHQTNTCFNLDGSKKQTRVEYEYNFKKQVTKQTEGIENPKVTLYSYDAFWNLHYILKPSGIKTIFSYDFLGRMQGKGTSDQLTRYVLFYDKKNRITEIKDLINQSSTCRKYDHYGNLKKETFQNGLTIQSVYDSFHRIKSIQYPDTTKSQYVYDAYHLKTVRRKTKNHKYSHQYYYTLNHLPTLEKLPLSLGYISHTYDVKDRETTLKSPFYTFAITGFDLHGNVTSHTNSLEDEPSSFAYNILSQLTSEDGSISHTYQNDALHNRLSLDNNPCSVNDLNELESTNDTTYTYDADGNLISQSNPDIQYKYDQLDRLTEITSQDQKVKYTYDGFDRRMTRKSYTLTDNTWIEDTYQKFFYDHQNEIGTCNADDTIRELRVLGLGKGAEIGAAIALELNGKLYIPLHDPYGNVIATIDPNTKTIEETYQYSAYGETLYPSSLNPWLYQSKRLEPLCEYYCFGRRFYDPKTARWITKDPKGYKEGPNLYQFLHSNPFLHYDLYGLSIIGDSKDRNYGMGDQPFSFIYEINPQNTLSYREIVFNNGINTTLIENHGMASRLSSLLGNVKVTSVYNQTQHCSDFIRTMAEKCGYRSKSVKILGNFLIEKTMAGKTIDIFAHSEGVLQLQLSLEMVYKVNPDLLDQINIYAFGPAEIITKEFGKEVLNFISKNDMVSITAAKYISSKTFNNSIPNLRPTMFPRLDKSMFRLSQKNPKWDLALNEGSLKLLEPNSWNFFKEHSFMGDTYQKQLKEICLTKLESGNYEYE